MKKKVLLTGLLAVSWIVSAAAWAGHPLPKYALIEIPSIVAAGGSMSAAAINDRNEVAGTYFSPMALPSTERLSRFSTSTTAVQ